MAVELDAVSSLASTVATPAVSGVWAHTVTAPANLLMVGLSIRTPASTATSVTYAGSNLTKILGVNGAAATVRGELWYLLNPATGTNNIVATLSATSHYVFGAVSYDGAHVTSPIGVSGSSTATNTTPNISLTTTANNSLIFDNISITNTSAYTPAAPNTNRWNAISTAGSAASNTRGAGNDRVTGLIGTYNASGTIAISREYVVTACEIKENYTYSQSFMM